jgi:uncharacterized protein YqgC (DUF456 family)
MEALAWVILVATMVVGALGTVLPGLPGAMLIFFGVLIHKMILPESFAWWTVSIVFGLAACSWLIDLLAGVAGAKWGGASKAGMIGAAIGGAVGVFLGPPGWILGPFFGAILGDLYSKRRDLGELFKSGLGAAFGFVLALVSRLVFLLAQVLVIFFALVF